MLTISEIHSLAKQKILILDGAMGTMIQAQKPEQSDFNAGPFADHPISLLGDNDVLNITRPDLVDKVHTAYLEAGADIIETNTFNANALSQAGFGLQKNVYDLAFAAAQVARNAVDRFTALTPGKPRMVAGSVGPTGRMASLSPDIMDPTKRTVTFDELADAYTTQIRGLIDGGVDIILIETVFDALNCKAAIYAADRAMAICERELPVMVSGSFSDASRRLLSGQTPEAFMISTSHARNLLSIGCNCGLGADGLRPVIEEYAAKASTLVSTHPNAGLPDGSGQYTQTPEIMAGHILDFAQHGLLNIVGGCCGTTPAHIRAIAEAVEGIAPRQPSGPEQVIRLSGFEAFAPVSGSGVFCVGNRSNSVVSEEFREVAGEEDLLDALDLTSAQIENGAAIIEVNMDAPELDTPIAMKNFLCNAASEPDIAAVPVMIESADWEVIRSALRFMQGKSIAGPISLKNGDEAFLEQAKELYRLGASIMVAAEDEQGLANTEKYRVAILSRAITLLKSQTAYKEQDIVLCPGITPISAKSPESGTEFLHAAAELHNLFPGCSIAGDIENISAAFDETIRPALNHVFLRLASANGLNLAIINPAMQETREDEFNPALCAAAEALLLNPSPEAVDKLISAN